MVDELKVTDPDKAFVADMTGIYAQHAAMWTVYTESIKMLVTVTSLPILAAGAFIASGKQQALDLAHLPSPLVWALLIVAIIDLLLLGVVIHHRLVILFYARGLNRYRHVYLNSWLGRPLQEDEHPLAPMPDNNLYPENYEPWGPMGLIVHGSAAINAMFVFASVYTMAKDRVPGDLAALGLAAVFALLWALFYELWYHRQCGRAKQRP